MKISPLSKCMLVACAATSQHQAEARPLPGGIGRVVSRGLATGAISTGVKNIVSGLQGQVDEDAPVERSKVMGSKVADMKQQRSPSVIAKKVLRSFPLNFGSNAVAIASVDRIVGVTTRGTIKNIKQLALPIACMGIAQEMLSEVQIPFQVKETLCCGAFLAGGVIQGKAVVSSGLAISGFVAGAAIVKSVVNHSVSKFLDSKRSGSNPSVFTPGVSATGAIGFMSPQSSDVADKVPIESYDSYIRSSYGLRDDETFWTGPDGSVFLPLSSQ